jgi:hypothetical protein
MRTANLPERFIGVTGTGRRSSGLAAIPYSSEFLATFSTASSSLSAS